MHLLQLLLESSHRRFALRNNSRVAFSYKITGSNAAPDEMVDNFDINSLMVEPNTGFVDAQSFVEFDVQQRPTILGPIDHRLQLEASPHLLSNRLESQAANDSEAYPEIYDPPIRLIYFRSAI